MKREIWIKLFFKACFARSISYHALHPFTLKMSQWYSANESFSKGWGVKRGETR